MHASPTRKGVPKGCPLTLNQYNLLGRLARGDTYKNVAADRGCSVSGLYSTASEAFALLGINSVGQAIALGLRNGWWGEFITRRGTPRKGDPYIDSISVSFDRWLASGFSDQDARDAMHLSVRAALAAKGVKAMNKSRVNHTDAHKFLDAIAQETLEPSPHVRRADG
jgi:DNA-binding CsgD family transcriptional regulator